MNIAMKMTVASVALVVSGMAAATDVCTGASEQKTVDVKAAAKFIVRDFKMSCSKNVVLVYDEANDVAAGIVAAWGAAGSTKGTTAYAGTTEGGGGAVKVFTAPTGTYLTSDQVKAQQDAKKPTGTTP